jgi:hypothetical protein
MQVHGKVLGPEFRQPDTRLRAFVPLVGDGDVLKGA